MTLDDFERKQVKPDITHSPETNEQSPQPEKEGVEAIFIDTEIAKTVNDLLNAMDIPNIKAFFLSFLENHPEDKQELIVRSGPLKTKPDELKTLLLSYINDSIPAGIDTSPIHNEKEETGTNFLAAKGEKEKNDLDEELIQQKRLEANKAREAIKQAHPDLPEITEESPFYQQVENRLKSSGEYQHLLEQGVNETIIHDYLLSQAFEEMLDTQETSVSPQEKAEYKRCMLDFRNSLHLKWGSFLAQDITKTTALLHAEIGNQAVAQFTSQKTKEYASHYDNVGLTGKEKIPEQPDKLQTYIKEGIKKFEGKKEGISKEVKTAYETISAKFEKQQPLSELEQQILQEMPQRISHLRAIYETHTQTTLQKWSTGSMVQGYMQYLDSETGNQFSYDVINDIYINNQMIAINGTLQGKNIAFRGDVSKHSHLQVQQSLVREGKGFALWPNKFWNLKHTVPSYDEIVQRAMDTYQKSADKLREQSVSQEEFNEKLLIIINKEIKKLYPNKELVTNNIDNAMKKDLAMQDTTTFLEKHIWEGMALPWQLTAEATPETLLNFYDKVALLQEHLHWDELETLWRTPLNALAFVVQQIKSWKSPGNVQIFQDENFKEMIQNTADIIQGKPAQWKNLFDDFFSLILTNKNTPDKKKLQEFSDMMAENTKSTPNENKFPTFVEAGERWNADRSLLDL